MNDELKLLLRGAVNVISEKELEGKVRAKKSLRVKLGVDPTSPDLHLGHTVVLNKLKCFQDQGHTVVFIVGDVTALIGDPSGRDETRPRMSGEDVDRNMKTYLDQVFKILDPGRTEVRKNSEWLDKVFDLGQIARPDSVFSKVFGGRTVQQLLQREDFAQRMKEGNPITIIEMLYPLFQGYDSVAVSSDVEMGGTDQLFNLLMGRELQKDFGQESQVVLTFPLLVGMDGSRKMSKSYGNHIGLNDPAGEMFGKLMSISDELMWQYYEFLTDQDLKTVKGMHPKEAKVKLAHDLTRLYHGTGPADSAQEEFEKVFSKNVPPDQIEDYPASKKNMLLSHLLFESGLAPSKKESKRLIENGGVRVDGSQVTEDREVEIRAPFILQVGKRKFKRIIPSI